MIDLKNLTIKKTQEMIKKREISSKELISYYFDVVKNKNKNIHAYLEVFKDAFETAKNQDKEILSGSMAKPFFGIALAIKDNILIKGKRCSASSKILENYKAVYDATVIEKLKNSGAIFLGRTNMDEFAMGSSTENSSFGITKNPLDLKRVAGGSSGGSAAAVSMDACAAALGSDTGGSIRQPAGFCGVIGLKPTYGAVSRYGLIAMASSLDQIGPITKTVEDAEILFNAIKGKDLLDSTSIDIKISKRPNDFKKLKIGIFQYDRRGVNKCINAAIDDSIKILENLGHEIEPVDLHTLRYSLSCYYIIMPAEVSANLARFDGIRYGLVSEGQNLLEDYMKTRAQGFGEETRRRIMLGTYVLSAGYYDAYYLRAQKVRTLIKKDFQKAFDLKQDGLDAILMPTSPTPAFKIGEKASDPLQMYLSDIFTVSANLAGLPAVSIPYKNKNFTLPVGIQFIAPWFREDILFDLGKQYNQEYE
ncbi:MAG: Asp-tRNA(Asn)/Glu-tRNA(Gln) amidotransferase subunit GatA [Patescibacteria group bacterium]